MLTGGRQGIWSVFCIFLAHIIFLDETVCWNGKLDICIFLAYITMYLLLLYIHYLLFKEFLVKYQ